MVLIRIILFYLLSAQAFFLQATDLEQSVKEIRAQYNIKVKTYDLHPEEPIDVVIPCAQKDLFTLKAVVMGIRAYGVGVRRIIILSSAPLGADAEWFDEALFPFDKYSIALEILKNRSKALRFVKEPKSRVGWIYQQLLKLYAHIVIPGISSNVLILDADTLFLNQTRFMDDLGAVLLNVGSEYHPPYFAHMSKLLPYLKRVHPGYSGVTHHMLFQKSIIEDFMAQIEQFHGCPTWKAICKMIDHRELRGSSFSEYEMYFNFCLLNTDQWKIRALNWRNVTSLVDMEKLRHKEISYISCHDWSRTD
jgi:hypothetical protein